VTSPARARRARRAGRPRPWRAIAYVVDPVAPNGRRREVAGRVSAATQDGLTRWVNAHRLAGDAVDVYRVGSFDEVLS
jgi:hypothetical protein